MYNSASGEVGILVEFHAPCNGWGVICKAAISGLETLLVVGEVPVAQAACTWSPGRVVVAPISATITS